MTLRLGVNTDPLCYQQALWTQIDFGTWQKLRSEAGGKAWAVCTKVPGVRCLPPCELDRLPLKSPWADQVAAEHSG